MEAVVVDAGSKLLKAGIALPDQAPSLVMPSKMKLEVEDGQMGDGAVVEEVVQPVVRGFVKDWDAMEDLLNYVLYSNIGWEIGDEGQILFTEPLFTPKALREQLAQLMFEKFNVSGFYDSEQAVLSLYAVGRISGCTVDIGHGKIDFMQLLSAYLLMLCPAFYLCLNSFHINKNIAPVCEGAVQHIASKRFDIGGTDLTKLFAEELKKSNSSVNIDISDVERLKEQYACCAEDQLAFEALGSSCRPERHTLPDGQVITIEKERYIVGEALFQPHILGLEDYGIVHQLVTSVSNVAPEYHRQLLENTMLCGGTASMTGFEDRFQREANLSASAICPSLVKPPEYMPENLARYSAWLGGAILAKVVFPQNQHVTKGDYDETGPSIVHKKCF
uniref:Actin-related protein 7 n=1 Tax=Leersia perrieri TaxID=77586 RepID=A0A0D9VZS8_9ORYZ